MGVHMDVWHDSVAHKYKNGGRDGALGFPASVLLINIAKTSGPTVSANGLMHNAMKKNLNQRSLLCPPECVVRFLPDTSVA